MRRTSRASYALITILALAVLAAVALVITRSARRSRSQAELLADAARELRYRPMEGRLVGFPFAPRQRPTRGQSDDDDTLLLRTAATIGAHATDPRSEAAAHLIAGKTDRAVDELKAATAAMPNDAAVWSDYAAALIEHGMQRNDGETVALALAAADTALQINPSLAEASFNRAVALERLELWPYAVDAYARAVAGEGDSAWRSEAMDRRRRLRATTEVDAWSAALAELEKTNDLPKFAQAVVRFPQQARMWAEGQCLATWAAAFVAGQHAEADRWLARARTTATALAPNGDTFVGDLLAAIDRATPAARNEIARGHVAYGAGRLAYKNRRVAEAAPHFDEAIARFRAGGSPMELMARYFRANVAFDENDSTRALELLHAADAEAHEHYIAFRAQTQWQRAVIFARLGRMYESLSAHLAAADGFASLGERENAARMRIYAATILSYLGRPADAWNARVRGYRDASISGNGALFEISLNTAARSELRARRWDVARSLFGLQLETPRPTPRLRFDAFLWRAYAGANCTPAAPAPDFAALRAAATAIPDGALRKDALSDTRDAEAYLVAERSPARALALLEQTLEYRQRNQHLAHIARTHTEIAKLQRTQGQNDAALAHLQQAIEQREEQSATVASDELRDAFFHSDVAPYELAIEMLIERGSFAHAFELAERMRARLLLERLRHDRAARPLSAAEVQARLPKDTTVVQIITSDGTTSLLIGSGDGFHGVTMARDVRPLIARDPLLAPRELFDLLIAPALRARPATKTLVIVPDDVAEGVPFAALRTPDQRFLIELATIVVPPSATTFLLARGAPATTPQGRSLFVADPQFDMVLFPRLERLFGARQEAEDLTRLYPRALVLTDAAATESRVREAASDAPMLHIAAHALTSRDDPRQSVLPLAVDREGGLLYLTEIAEWKLRARPVVVLNGCQTGVSSSGAGSVRSLASAFLIAGARSVVATLWDIDDGHARKLSLALHERLTRGQPVASALRSTQLQMLHSPNPSLRDPRFWSAFQTFGSDQ